MREPFTCPGCETGSMEVFHKINSVPANSCILLASRQDALDYPRGDIQLGFCSSCGFISNVAFDGKLTEYSTRYEETQGFSPTFNNFHKLLAQRLIDTYDLREKDIIEIGCGKGEFLMLLCELGNNRGVGFDPGFRRDRVDESVYQRINFIQDFYTEAYAAYQADLLCCKMTLEHIHLTAAFLRTVRRSIGDRLRTLVFFQIPEATRIFKNCAFEDIYYEHCSYFTPGSLARLFHHCGFNVIKLRTEYGDQYLTIEARPADRIPTNDNQLAEESDLKDVLHYVNGFHAKFEAKRQRWQHQLDEFVRKGKNIVLWGSGSKAVAFLTTLKIPSSLEYVVDINPNRIGYYMSGTGQKIVSPEFLIDYKPDTVIVMNPMYCEEISADLALMGLNPEIMAL